MSNEKIYDMFKKFSLAFNGEISNERLKFYVEYFSKTDISELRLTLNEIAKNNKFFPSIAEIMDRLPSQSNRNTPLSVVNKLYELVIGLGSHRSSEAILKLPVDARRMINEFGGFNEICRMSYFEINRLKPLMVKWLEDYASNLDEYGDENILDNKPKQERSLTEAEAKEALEDIYKTLGIRPDKGDGIKKPSFSIG